MISGASYLPLQPPEEMYDPEIYRPQITEYSYNPYVLDGDIQAGEILLSPTRF